MDKTPNPQLELAYDYVQNTNKNIFLTGKAGTGKTTFLHRVRESVVKNMVVVAPTGVAAINAKGMTMHSFFQLPFGPFLPGNKEQVSRQRKISAKKRDLIRSLDLVIIDEISMVRADVLDAVDDVLRRYKDFTKPFGGVQLLMIGDLHQLPPVARREEWDLLQVHYNTPYFFGSLALQKTNNIVIELTHIYRQSDDFFINLLNKVRNNQMDQEVLDAINSRYIPNFKPPKDEHYITLTSHNAAANNINNKRLKEIDTPKYTFKAEVKGNFPPKNFPTEEVLELKVGAQIVFIKNDLSYEKRYYNGKIGTIEQITDDKIFIQCDDEVTRIPVERQTWDNVEYDLDKDTKEVTEDIVGSFTQFPFKLAWAITIHKSQGLTFEKAIIDAKAAFAHGQVYVALSRCKTFEGIVLLSKIGHSSVKTDRVVQKYSDDASQNQPTEAELKAAKRVYQQDLILELFDFRNVKWNSIELRKTILVDEHKFVQSPVEQIEKLANQIEKEIINVSEKFKHLLQRKYFLMPELPAENEHLTARIQKAGGYFSEKFKTEIIPALHKIPLITDNSALKKKAKDQMEQLEKNIFIKNACFSACKSGFAVEKYIKARTKSELEFGDYIRKVAAKKMLQNVPANTPHAPLYAQLLQWRQSEADQSGNTLYEILRTSALLEISEKLPRDKVGLLKIKGIGRGKVKRFGSALIDMVDEYCTENNITADTFIFDAPPKPPKKDTKQTTLEMYNLGKSINKIAMERKLKPSTIEGHIAYFIQRGQVNVYQAMPAEVVDKIADYFRENQTTSLGDAKKHFEDKYSYGELKMVLAHLKVEG